MKKLDISGSMGVAVFLASKSLERFAEIEMKNRLGLTPSQWKTILALNLNNGLTQKDLAERLFMDGSTLVPIIDKMERNGLVQRRSDPNDRRNNRIFLTKKSESVADFIIDIIENIKKIALKGVSQDEIKSTRIILNKITENSDKAVAKVKSK